MLTFRRLIFNSKSAQLCRFFSREELTNNISQNPTIPNLFTKKIMPLGRWCTKESSVKCDPEKKADLANHDNGPGYTVNPTSQGTLQSNRGSQSKLQIDSDLTSQINQRLFQESNSNVTASNLKGAGDNFNSSEDSLLISYHSSKFR